MKVVHAIVAALLLIATTSVLVSPVSAVEDNSDADPDTAVGEEQEQPNLRLLAKKNQKPKKKKKAKKKKEEDPPTKTLIHFTSGDLEMDPALWRRVDIADSLGGNLDGRFIDFNDKPFISIKECESLKKFTDMKLQEALLSQSVDEKGQNITEDFLYHLTPEELQSMVNLKSIQAMYHTLKNFNPEFPVSRVSLRRTDNTGSKHIRYHIDGPSTVMHVWLNDPRDLEGGGKYLFLGRNGTTKIDNIPGLAIVHGDEIVHGVAAFKGVRYTLLLVGDHKDSTDILEPVCTSSSTAAVEK